VGGAKPIQFSLQGPDLSELQRLTRALSARLSDVAGLVDLDTSLKPDKPTLSVQVRRDAASDVGLSVGSITSTLRSLVGGQTVGNWRASNGENYDVKVRLAPEVRERTADLARIGFTVGTNSDGGARVVRLAQVADLEPSTTASQINRRDLNREVEFTANAAGRSLGEVSADIRKVLQSTALPPGYTTRFGGATRDMQESFSYALQALALGVIFIYMILASQFRSFVQPLALMSSLPLTLIGVVLALLAFRSTLNLFSVIGIVLLMGLVTKNAILLIDFAIRAREGSADGSGPGLPLVFGMLPLALALSEGAEQRAPMGQAVIGGVITSSLLTLVVVPVVYCYLDDLSTWTRHRWLRRRGSAAAAA
jgi:HAE1 family hydrophobic/amphiphilic exporter-1